MAPPASCGAGVSEGGGDGIPGPNVGSSVPLPEAESRNTPVHPGTGSGFTAGPTPFVPLSTVIASTPMQLTDCEAWSHQRRTAQGETLGERALAETAGGFGRVDGKPRREDVYGLGNGLLSRGAGDGAAQEDGRRRIGNGGVYRVGGGFGGVSKPGGAARQWQPGDWRSQVSTLAAACIRLLALVWPRSAHVGPAGKGQRLRWRALGLVPVQVSVASVLASPLAR